jgi:biopolymer transport protein ExbB
MQIELLKLISQGGMVSIIVAAILLAMSIGSWTLMVVKAVQLRRLRSQNTHFVAALKPAEHQSVLIGDNRPGLACSILFDQDSIKAVITPFIKGEAKLAISPYARLTFQGLHASEHYGRCAKDNNDSTRNRNDFIGQTLRRTINNEAIKLESGLTLLASIGSIAPFVGLFGTVWGIYHALGAIAVGGQATVEKVAGPVGEALIMTAFGLAVAMPAVLAYNTFIRDNRLLMAELENFAHDLFTSLTLGGTPADKPVARPASNKANMAVVS